MATVLDISILSNLSIIFVFVAIFTAGWGLLYLVNPFGFKDDNKKKVYSVLAFALAFIVILSPIVLGLIVFSIPWLTVILMAAFFLLFFAKIFDPGLPTQDLIGKPVVYGFLIFFTALVFLFGMGGIFGQALLETQPGVGEQVDQATGQTVPADSFVPVGEVRPAPSGNGAPASGSQDFGSNLILTLFHPNILGMLFMLLLGTVTILLIGR